MSERIEQVYIANNGVKIIYKHKPSKHDFKHLIVVFSGFLNTNPGNYDFNNALNDCPSDVIWINDNFENMYTYYLCINMDFKVENAITEFIKFKMAELGMDFHHVTVTGFSKGGSAALYYGLKLPVKNIVTTVPQTKIGSYVVKNWNHVAQHMMGSITKVKQDYLDRLIIQSLKQASSLNKNIYLLTSEADIQYEPEIVPVLNDLRKFSNFNLIKTYSVFCREHNQITSHHTAMLLGLYYCLASEAEPYFPNNEVNFFGAQPLPFENKSGEFIVDTRMLNIRDKRLFIEGVGIARGYDITEYQDVDYELIFKGKTIITKSLAKAHRPYLTKEFFDGRNLVIYDKGWFTTYQYKGIDISDLPKDNYELFIKIRVKDIQKELPLTTSKDLSKEIGSYFIQCVNNNLILNLR